MEWKELSSEWCLGRGGQACRNRLSVLALALTDVFALAMRVFV